MKQNMVATLEKNHTIAHGVYLMRLACPTDWLAVPGQFVNIQLDGFYLRRPISVCDWDEAGIEIIYKILGEGTATMATMEAGQRLDLLVGLGNGFATGVAAGKKTVLVGGGVGVPPLYGLAKRLVAKGNTPKVVLGFRSHADVFYADEFARLGCEVEITTEDGSSGSKGYVTTLLEAAEYEYYYTCGPNAMLEAVYKISEQKCAAGQLSFEERMGCGFGACMGCSCHTKGGAKRVCVEGPVFSSEEVLFT